MIIKVYDDSLVKDFVTEALYPLMKHFIECKARQSSIPEEEFHNIYLNIDDFCQHVSLYLRNNKEDHYADYLQAVETEHISKSRGFEPDTDSFVDQSTTDALYPLMKHFIECKAKQFEISEEDIYLNISYEVKYVNTYLNATPNSPVYNRLDYYGSEHA